MAARPTRVSHTAVSIVSTVTTPNTVVTSSTPGRLSWAAGYISSGISGSQGPSTKITKMTQGVIDAF